MPVTYVFGDLAGAIESPVYALAALNKKLDALSSAGGKEVPRLGLSHPDTPRSPSSSGTASGTSPSRSSATWGWPSRRCWC